MCRPSVDLCQDRRGPALAGTDDLPDRRAHLSGQRRRKCEQVVCLSIDHTDGRTKQSRNRAGLVFFGLSIRCCVNRCRSSSLRSIILSWARACILVASEHAQSPSRRGSQSVSEANAPPTYPATREAANRKCARCLSAYCVSASRYEASDEQSAVTWSATERRLGGSLRSCCCCCSAASASRSLELTRESCANRSGGSPTTSVTSPPATVPGGQHGSYSAVPPKTCRKRHTYSCG